MKEFDFIKKYLTPLASEDKVSFSFEDDCCNLPLNEYIVTNDIIVEGVHFFPDDSPESIAHKLIHVNLSDIVSKGSSPKFYNLSLTLSSAVNEEWLQRFCSKLYEIQNKYDFTLIGGDTTFGPSLVLSGTFFGTKEVKHVPTTRNAEIGDEIFISGTIGDSYLGLLSKKKEIAYLPEFEEKYLFPTSRIDLVTVIRNYAKSSTDISDGLVRDLNKILTSSKVGAELILPNHLFKNESFKHPISSLITAGDDYQIIMISSPGDKEKIEKISDFKFVGKIIKDNILNINDSSGRKITLNNSGFQHAF